jgi:ABC-type Fe3+ transport system permease subunit
LAGEYLSHKAAQEILLPSWNANFQPRLSAGCRVTGLNGIATTTLSIGFPWNILSGDHGGVFLVNVLEMTMAVVPGIVLGLAIVTPFPPTLNPKFKVSNQTA